MWRYLFILVFLLVPFVPTAQAQLQPGVFEEFLTPTFETTYDTSGDLESRLPAAVGSVITVLLSIVGVILLVIIVYSGFLWLTAGGNEDQVKDAKQRIKNGVIGLIIILGAYLITSFVVQQVQQAVSSGGGSIDRSAAPEGSLHNPSPPSGGDSG